MSTSLPVDSAPSLLDVVIPVYNETKQKRVVRALVSGVLSSPASEHVLEEYVYSFQSPQMDDAEITSESLTGLGMVVNQSVFFFLLEGPEETVLTLIRDACVIGGERPASAIEDKSKATEIRPGQAPSGATGVMKVCSYSEDVPREFNTISFRHSRTTVEDVQSLTNPSKTTWTILMNLLELGREACAIGSASKAREYVSKSNARQLLQRLPTAEKLVLQTTCDEVPSADEWLRLFEDPLDDFFDEEAWIGDDFTI